MIRPRIVKILIRREVRRLQKNPSAIGMLGLLAAVALLMAIGTNKDDGNSVIKAEDMAPIVIVVDQMNEQVRSIKQAAPTNQDVRFELRDRLSSARGALIGPRGWSIVEWRNREGAERTKIEVHYVGESQAAIQPFLDWFHPAIYKSMQGQPWVEHAVVPRYSASAVGDGIRQASVEDLMKTELLGTTLLLMVQFFCCCHLLVSFTAQDREQKTLSALALTTARLSEIMVAKGIFHLTLSLAGSFIIVAILKPVLLMNPIFWLTVLLGSVSTMCVGTCIATLAKNQAAAGMLALCYMMAGAILFFLASRLTVFAALKALTVECYSFMMLYFVFKNPSLLVFMRALIPMLLLTGAWILAARKCFYRFGWK